MRQLRLRLTALLLMTALLAGLSPAAFAAGGVTAKAGNIDVSFNGAAMKLGTYNIASNNYVKLRDVAQLLKGTGKGFSITWNGAAQRIDLTSGGTYATVGGELGALAEEDQTAVPNSASVWLDGEAVNLTAYTISGNNFFKLRDLGSAMNFYVGWDAGTGTVIVDTSKGYMPENPAPAGEQSAMAQAMLAVLDNVSKDGFALNRNARLADVDGDGVPELIATHVLLDDSYYAVLYDWKDGALQANNIGNLAGGGFEWWICRDTVTGELGILFQNHSLGEGTGDATITFYYPTRQFQTYQVQYWNDWDYPSPGVEVEKCSFNGTAITRAEYDAILGQNQRVELLLKERSEEDPNYFAETCVQLNGML